MSQTYVLISICSPSGQFFPQINQNDEILGEMCCIRNSNAAKSSLFMSFSSAFLCTLSSCVCLTWLFKTCPVETLRQTEAIVSFSSRMRKCLTELIQTSVISPCCRLSKWSWWEAFEQICLCVVIFLGRVWMYLIAAYMALFELGVSCVVAYQKNK